MSVDLRRSKFSLIFSACVDVSPNSTKPCSLDDMVGTSTDSLDSI